MNQQQQRRNALAGGRLGLLLGVAALTTACGGPADKKMVTNGSQQEYRASIDAIDAELTPHEREAFNWAVAGLDLEKLNQRYPNASIREVVRSQVKAVREQSPKSIQSLRDQAKAQEPLLLELGKIKTSEEKFAIESSFFGPTPIIEARIANASSLPLSKASWLAKLYIDGQPQPVAQSRVLSDFRPIDGLKPGHQVTARFKVGFVKGDETWTTLAIRQAATTRVELSVVPDSALDFSDKPYLKVDHQKAIEQLEYQLKQADGFADI
ncbi:hypothetical protein [Stenotrophomonas sp. S39]|uniref:hypothetical protein n=1 Tax=Stenotrophomonas sp. S39 TaxID=2767451 RepID=UPI00190B1D84|nr:hypothetical protein [Stenotrophomonas sp. S39]MBK0052669.1 hypothetical protein [Stenotrophomonas sp. S39]